MNTIYLRGVNWQHLLDRYLSGEFSEDSLIKSGKTHLKSSYVKPIARGATADFPTYTYKEEGADILVFTNNCKQYELKKDECLQGSDGEGGLAVIEGQICRWCRDPIKRKPIGIPVRYFRNSKDNKNVMHFDGIYCTFECAFATLKTKTLGGSTSDRYRFSEAYLRSIFERSYPGINLKAASDWGIHANNGGTVSSESFHSPHHYFVELSNWYFLPCKGMYRQIVG